MWKANDTVFEQGTAVGLVGIRIAETISIMKNR